MRSSDVGVLTTLNYTFMYSKDIQVGDRIKLKLPGFSAHGSYVKELTTCGKSVFTVLEEEGSMENFSVALTLANFTLPATTQCDIYLGGLITPTLPYRDAIAQAHFSATFNDSITSAVFPIRSTLNQLNLHGKMSSDSIKFSSTLPQASGVRVTYEFKYSKILFVGDKVEIALPSFSGIPTTVSSCSSTQFGIDHKDSCSAK